MMFRKMYMEHKNRKPLYKTSILEFKRRRKLKKMFRTIEYGKVRYIKKNRPIEIQKKYHLRLKKISTAKIKTIIHYGDFNENT